mgnify:CR=1 FL=1
MTKEITIESRIKAIEVSEDTSWLLARFEEKFTLTVEAVRELAAIVKRLDELDVELEINPKILAHFRKVAYGQVIPELVANLQGSPALLNRASMLPLPDQQRIANDEPIQLALLSGDHRAVSPSEMTPRELRQAFNKSAIRTNSEQVGWLRDEQIKTQAKTRAKPAIALDGKRKGIVVGDVFISTKDMLGYLNQLSK